MTSVPSSIAYQDGYNDAVKLFTSNKHINEIKAQGIEEALSEVSPIGVNRYGYDYDGADLRDYTRKLRGGK